jgi:hypothetical protein
MERDEVFSITTAQSGHHDDLLRREIRYGISMGVRTLCFVGAVITWQTMSTRWVPVALMIGALVLPYTSVILANAGVRRRSSGDSILTPDSQAVAKRDESGPA